MTKLLTWIRVVRNIVSFGPAEPCPEQWTDAHAKALRAFLATEAGRLMTRQIEGSRSQVARRAVLYRGQAEYAAGYAAGYDTACAILDELSAIGQPQPAEEQPQPGLLGGKALAETLAP